MRWEHNDLLDGHSTSKRIVATERVYSGSNKGNLEHIFVREEDGRVTESYEPIRPFFYCNSADDAFTEMLLDDDVEITYLEADEHTHYDALVHCDHAYIPKDYEKLFESDNFLYQPVRNCGYLLSTGNTLFKGMDITDLLVAYVDIEVYTSAKNAGFVNSQRSGDKIIIITTLLSNGTRRMFMLDDDVNKGQYPDDVVCIDSERSLLKLWMGWLTKLDPDVVVGHNLCNFDFPYINDRCKLHGLSFNIGRGGKEAKSYHTKMKLAERDVEYDNWMVYGRHVLDTQLLAMKADVTKREMPNYKLKDLIKWMGIAKDDREYIDGKDLSEYYDTKRDKLVKYAFGDVEETQVLFNEFSAAYFYLAQMTPFSFQDCYRLGSGSIFGSLFFRAYYRAEYGIPKISPLQTFPGGYAGIFKFGHINKSCVYLDVASLYPTLAEDLMIRPIKDTLEIFQPIIRELKKRRLVIKELSGSEKDSTKKKMYKSGDAAIKIILNTGSYGILASQYFEWNDYDEAERITLNGRRTIKSMMFAASEFGGDVVKVDTDGMLIGLVSDDVEFEKQFATDVELFVNHYISNGLYEGNYDDLLEIE